MGWIYQDTVKGRFVVYWESCGDVCTLGHISSGVVDGDRKYGEEDILESSMLLRCEVHEMGSRSMRLQGRYEHSDNSEVLL